MNDMVKSRLEEAKECDRELAEALAAHMENFVRVGLLLERMRKGLWKELAFKSFEAYVKERFEMSKQRAYQLMDAAEIRLKIPDLPDPDPASQQVVDSEPAAWNEHHMRQLGRLASPSKAKAVAERVVKEVREKRRKGEKIKLGSIVRKHVNEALGITQERKEPEPGPMFLDLVQQWIGKLQGIADIIEQTDVRQFVKEEPGFTKDLAAAIARLQKAWEGPASAAKGWRGKKEDER